MSGFDERGKKEGNQSFYGFEDRITPILFYVPILLVKTCEITNLAQNLEDIFLGEIFVYTENLDEFLDLDDEEFNDVFYESIREKYLSKGYRIYDVDALANNYRVLRNSTQNIDITIKNGRAIIHRQEFVMKERLNNYICMFKSEQKIYTIGFPYQPGQKEIDFLRRQRWGFEYVGVGGTNDYLPDYQFVKLLNGKFVLFSKSYADN